MKPVFYESTLFDISRKKQVYTSMPSRHYHDAYEILYLISGDFYYFIGDRTYQVAGGTLLFMDIHEMHKLVNSGCNMYERVTLLFKKNSCSISAPAVNVRNCSNCSKVITAL